MSSFADAMKAVREVLLMQTQIERLDKQSELQGEDLRGVKQNVIDIDKRVVRIETMIEMSAQRGTQPPLIEGN
jgi:hypothetical protein